MFCVLINLLNLGQLPFSQVWQKSFKHHIISMTRDLCSALKLSEVSRKLLERIFSPVYFYCNNKKQVFQKIMFKFNNSSTPRTKTILLSSLQSSPFVGQVFIMKNKKYLIFTCKNKVWKKWLWKKRSKFLKNLADFQPSIVQVANFYHYILVISLILPNPINISNINLATRTTLGVVLI